MSQDVAARLAALSQDHREGRLTVSAYRSLRAPLLDMLVTAESLVGAEPVDPFTTTRPRHRPPAVGTAVGAAVGAAGGTAAGTAGGESLGLLAPGDSLVEASALARKNLQPAVQVERGAGAGLIAVGSALLVAGLIAAWLTWSPREPTPPVAGIASPAKVESEATLRAPDRVLTPMPPPLSSETKRKSTAPLPTAVTTASADAPACEPPAKAMSTPVTPCLDRISATELGPRLLLLAGPAANGVVFAISARPVSQAQFRLFCQRTSRPFPRQPWTEEDDPVVNVTWNEARDYLAWLSSITGKRYRLATETEWLYFVGQAKVDARWRNGNVREWLQDTVNDAGVDSERGEVDAADVASTALDASTGIEQPRVVRGVSYADAATDLLIARRSRDASTRDALIGFRALREIH